MKTQGYPGKIVVAKARVFESLHKARESNGKKTRKPWTTFKTRLSTGMQQPQNISR